MTAMKYKHISPKEAEADPWERLFVDLIGPYTKHRKVKDNLQLKYIPNIEPTKSWTELHEYSH